MKQQEKSGAQENPRLPEHDQHVVETPAETQGNAELTGKDCPAICPTLGGGRAVKIPIPTQKPPSQNVSRNFVSFVIGNHIPKMSVRHTETGLPRLMVDGHVVAHKRGKEWHTTYAYSGLLICDRIRTWLMEWGCSWVLEPDRLIVKPPKSEAHEWLTFSDGGHIGWHTSAASWGCRQKAHWSRTGADEIAFDNARLKCSTGKIVYSTEDSAKFFARADRGVFGTNMRAYECAECGQWHLSSIKRRPRPQLEQEVAI